MSGSEFVEVADRVLVARQEWFDLNVVVVAGRTGSVVVDTHASAAAARAVVERVRRLGVAPVTAVVNTHEHFDHTFGNLTFRDALGLEDAQLLAHEEAAARTVAAGERIKREYAADPSEPRGEEVIATAILPAGRTFSSATVLDLGDRQVELVHPGRGHTGGDLVVRVPDADVVLGGDLIEESAAPGYGDDSWPLEWPATLDLVIELCGPGTVVVPGHGAVVDRSFVADQREDVAAVAETIRALGAAGVPLERALAEGSWPFPAAGLAAAVRRGYAHLPPGARSLPLLR
ncbi:MAG: MBL fold metallo-hydrolase [Marmoricola sp.]